MKKIKITRGIIIYSLIVVLVSMIAGVYHYDVVKENHELKQQIEKTKSGSKDREIKNLKSEVEKMKVQMKYYLQHTNDALVALAKTKSLLWDANMKLLMFKRLLHNPNSKQIKKQ